MKSMFIEDSKKNIDKSVELYGWVQTVRDHKKVVFIDLRDSTGCVQVVAGSDAAGISVESVVRVKGIVAKRPAHLVNSKVPLGDIEIQAKSVATITRANVIPIPLDTEGHEIDEEIRLKYRYLDLRRERMRTNMVLRSKTTSFIRNYLTKVGFIEVETPILTKTTPEGARDFIVPSRLQKGNFYALPQSPQQYKQLLMVAGVERYFQIARCFRDEDPRADRAYGEFVQLDIEMSFVEQNDILALIEDLFTQLVAHVFPSKKIQASPWPRITHAQAQKEYGTDKPDMRKDPKDVNELAFCWVVDYPLFTHQSTDDFYHGSGKAEFAPSHHMFTAPHPDDVQLLKSDPSKVRGLQHDLVLNGYEVGGGSVRIHDPKVQELVFDLIGFTDTQKKEFSHMLEAFQYGVPPHGGIAPGIDRLLMAILGETSVREVIAFPASSGGRTAVMDAPSHPSQEQLDELALSTIE